jgi:uncharacterized UPF0160 family protein
MIFSRKQIIVTHNGSFHADDIFACATLAWYLETKGKKYRIVRTRDESIIAKADYVLDVGGIYDHEHKRYDHHQPEGAGMRNNDIPYASFGLIWKHYGPSLCSDIRIADDIDRRLAQPIDAIDNGVSITDCNDHGLYDYGIHGVVSAYQATSNETTKEHDKYFLYLVNFFKGVLKRELIHTQERYITIENIINQYSNQEDTSIVICSEKVSISIAMQALGDHKEVAYVIAKSGSNNWKALALRNNQSSFESRVPFPKAWAGKRNKELQELSGVDDAVFCHNSCNYICVAKSKEGALALAKRSLELHKKK